ncbi:MAG TPA: hypothetical protein PKC83_03750 [Gemmatimonadaceae bacterium]|nr:MAG: hypothetical protein ABS52_13310 [Gemmatimonadetes bacterium SCN 70-22]HMN07878.1 hypothetical protein [Gemmatimonadaceae bacterium]
MPISRPSRYVSRTLGVLVAGVALVTACDTSVGFSPSQQRWGFINIAALKNTAGEYRLAPNATFFRGSITSIPDARIRTDSCFAVGDYVPPSSSNFSGVTFLDAGESISARIGAATTPIPRVTSGGALTYALGTGTTIPFTPGDSVVITVPGVAGGFPASEIRGRSAEPFTLIDPITPSTTSIPLKWTAATDGNSALIVSLQYTPSGTGAKTQEIRCAYTDDGVDSIPLRQHQAWSATSNVDRAVVLTRLRTSIIPVTDGAMEIISTFVVPTPTP